MAPIYYQTYQTTTARYYDPKIYWTLSGLPPDENRDGAFIYENFRLGHYTKGMVTLVAPNGLNCLVQHYTKPDDFSCLENV